MDQSIESELIDQMSRLKVRVPFSMEETLNPVCEHDVHCKNTEEEIVATDSSEDGIVQDENDEEPEMTSDEKLKALRDTILLCYEHNVRGSTTREIRRIQTTIREENRFAKESSLSQTTLHAYFSVQ